MVGLSAATLSDCCHTVTHYVPIQAQHPLSWSRKFHTTNEPPLPLPHRLPRPFEGTSGGPEVIVDARTCLFVDGGVVDG